MREKAVFPGDLAGAYAGAKLWPRKHSSDVYEIPLTEDKCIIVWSNWDPNEWYAGVYNTHAINRMSSGHPNVSPVPGGVDGDPLDVIAFIEQAKQEYPNE